VPLGEITMTPGRGGVGKSTFHVWLIGHLTRGTLPGVYLGVPRPCIIAASEDSWERTIVGRLIAADADMSLVFRAEVIVDGDLETSLTLPADCAALEVEIRRVGAVLLSVDPLISTVAGRLDSHKDREVRQALQPLAQPADRTGCTVLGNAHFGKSTGHDPLALMMGSVAFGNVARAVLGFAQDTDTEDGSCVISQVKSNLGRLDLPSLRYRIDETFIHTDEGVTSVGKLIMLGESDRSVHDILRDRGGDDRSERDEAADWLTRYLIDRGVRRSPPMPSRPPATASPRPPSPAPASKPTSRHPRALSTARGCGDSTHEESTKNPKNPGNERWNLRSLGGFFGDERTTP
jgi:hypothetical protein